jgi:4'-phosphopantetheinyl transferase
LAAGETHVWRVPLDGAAAAAALAALDAEERARAGRFRQPRDRERFAAARGGLRGILGAYRGAPAREIAFRYGEQGKPALAAGTSPLRFNLSHSGELALVAVRLGEEVGVDVERLRPVPDAAHMVERFLPAAAGAAFRALPEAQRQRGFLRLWTRQEAYLKALGAGLSGRLDELPGEGWDLRDLEPASGYVAAVAGRGSLGALRLFDWAG